jgi:hypothetical protein
MHALNLLHAGCHVRRNEETKAQRDEYTFLFIKGRTLKQTNKTTVKL